MNHPAEDPEPVHEWHEMNWLPKNLPFSENPGPLSGAAALNAADSIEPKDFVELFISDLLIQNISVFRLWMVLHSMLEFMHGSLSQFQK